MFLDANVIFSGVHSPGGTPARLLRFAASGTFDAVVCSAVLREVVRNLDRKVTPRPPGLDLLVSAGVFEIRPDPPPTQVDPWAALGFGTDATIVAAAIASDVDYLCTGDRRLLRELPGHGLAFNVVNPAALVALIENQDLRSRD